VTGTFINVGAILAGMPIGAVLGGRMPEGLQRRRARRPRPGRAGDRGRPRARVARHEAAVRAGRRAAGRPRRGAALDRGPPRGTRRLDPAARRGGSRNLVARERGPLRRQPALLRRPAGRRRRDPGRPHGRLRGAGDQGDAGRLRLDRAVGHAGMGRRARGDHPCSSTRARSRSAPPCSRTSSRARPSTRSRVPEVC
jgi:hypothetical protein